MRAVRDLDKRAPHEAIFIGLTKAAAVCSKASIGMKQKMGGNEP
jgi:hypothetical protein